LHPKYLDAGGLVALWRRTLGYRDHPQLARFRDLAPPRGGIAQYLRCVHSESLRPRT